MKLLVKSGSFITERISPVLYRVLRYAISGRPSADRGHRRGSGRGDRPGARCDAPLSAGTVPRLGGRIEGDGCLLEPERRSVVLLIRNGGSSPTYITRILVEGVTCDAPGVPTPSRAVLVNVAMRPGWRSQLVLAASSPGSLRATGSRSSSPVAGDWRHRSWSTESAPAGPLDALT
jgi:hypothetical protein